MFKDWLKLGIMLHDNDYLTEDLLCPECNKKCIDYAFVGDSKTRASLKNKKRRIIR